MPEVAAPRTEAPAPLLKLTEDEQLFRDNVRRFAEEKVAPLSREMDEKGVFDHSLIDQFFQLGLMSIEIPEQFGGGAGTFFEAILAVEELSRACASTGVIVSAHTSLATWPIFKFGTRAQKDQYLNDMTSGRRLGAFALTEKEAGSDAGNVQMTATPSADGSHFILNGAKRYITNAAIAKVLTVMARTPVPGQEGKTAITAFLVTPDMPGFEMINGRMEKMGIRGTATAEFALRGVRVPKENILGKPGKGRKVALTVLDFGRMHDHRED